MASLRRPIPARKAGRPAGIHPLYAKGLRIRVAEDIDRAPGKDRETAGPEDQELQTHVDKEEAARSPGEDGLDQC